MRINIPGNPEQVIRLAQAILARHAALGAASPLNGIEGIEAFASQTAAADTASKAAKDFAKKSATATEARDRALGADLTTPGFVRFFVTSARDTLAGLNKGKEHKLGEWGFEVNAPAQVTPAAKAAKAAAKNKPANA